MFFIFISVLFLACLLAGWGALCARFVRIETDNPWLYPFLGMFVAGTVFSAASMFLPLNDSALIVFALAGLAGLPLWGRELYAWRSRYSPETCGMFLAFVLTSTLLLAARCAYTEWAGTYDTDLYHANIVRWLNEYGTPLGLANLHIRLGNNSIWLTLAALFDNGYWDNRTAWLMPTLLALCAIAYLLHNVLFSTARTVRLFCGCMLFFVIGMSARRWGFPNLYFDFPALLVNVIVFAECLARAEDGWHIKPGQAALILCLAALSFAIKPIAGVSVLFASGIVLYGLKQSRALSITHLCVAFLPAVVAGIIWIARNSLLSGYPLFPLPLLPLPADWTVPREIVVWKYEFIIAHARSHGWVIESLPNWSWVVPWLKRLMASGNFWLYAGCPLVAAIPLWVMSFYRKQNTTPLVFGVWILLCLCYWFFSAPGLRFGAVFFQIFFALGLAFALRQVSWPIAWEARYVNVLQNRRVYHTILAVALIIATSVSIGQFHSSKRGLVHVGSIPSRELLSRSLDTSVAPPILLFLAANGNHCGNSPLPCTPYDNPRLRLRVPGNLGGGFYIE